MELTLDQALQKGIEAHKAGKAEEADRYYTAILKTQPKHPDANHNMGVLAVGVGKVNEALPFFVTALEVNPSVAQFWLSYIDALIKLNKATEAKSILDKAKQHGANGDAFDNIEEKLQKLVPNKKQPLNTQEPPQDQLDLLNNLYTQGQLQKVLDKTSKLLEQYPMSSELYYIIGLIENDLNLNKPAIENFKKAIDINPNSEKAYLALGIAQFDMGKTISAFENFKKVIDINPKYTPGYLHLGYYLQSKEKYQSALGSYITAIKLAPNSTEPYKYLANLLTSFEASARNPKLGNLIIKLLSFSGCVRPYKISKFSISLSLSSSDQAYSFLDAFLTIYNGGVAI